MRLSEACPSVTAELTSRVHPHVHPPDPADVTSTAMRPEPQASARKNNAVYKLVVVCRLHTLACPGADLGGLACAIRGAPTAQLTSRVQAKRINGAAFPGPRGAPMSSPPRTVHPIPPTGPPPGFAPLVRQPAPLPFSQLCRLLPTAMWTTKFVSAARHR